MVLSYSRCGCLQWWAGCCFRALPVNEVSEVAHMHFEELLVVQGKYFIPRRKSNSVNLRFVDTCEKPPLHHKEYFEESATGLPTSLPWSAITWHCGTPTWQSSQSVETSLQEEKRKQTNLKKNNLFHSCFPSFCRHKKRKMNSHLPGRATFCSVKFDSLEGVTGAKECIIGTKQEVLTGLRTHILI